MKVQVNSQGMDFVQKGQKVFEGAPDAIYTLNRKLITSPSRTRYSLPSKRSLPASRACFSPPRATSSSKAIILAASRGNGLDDLTRDRPKCMIPIGGTPAIEKQLQHLRAEGVRDISVVRGYCPDALKPDGVALFDNLRWNETGESSSLAEAREVLKGDVVIAYGDILYKRYILHELMASNAPITLVIDGSRAFLDEGKKADRVKVSAPCPTGFDESDFSLLAMGRDIPDEETHGEWIGLARLRGEGLWWVIRREVLPNAMPPLVAEFGLRFCFVFLFLSALSFLGLGIQPPKADWGSMVRDNATLISFVADDFQLGIMPLLPAAAIALLTVGVNFVVDWFLHKTSGLRDDH